MGLFGDYSDVVPKILGFVRYSNPWQTHLPTDHVTCITVPAPVQLFDVAVQGFPPAGLFRGPRPVARHANPQQCWVPIYPFGRATSFQLRNYCGLACHLCEFWQKLWRQANRLNDITLSPKGKFRSFDATFYLARRLEPGACGVTGPKDKEEEKQPTTHDLTVELHG